MNAEPHRFFKPSVFRVSQPPGGRTNDIFGTSPSTNGHSHKMMHDDHHAKLSADVNSNTLQQHVPAKMSPRRCDNTASRLFGADGGHQTASPRRLNATYAPSSIFADDAPKSPARTPKKTIPIAERNPITGEVKPPRTPQQSAQSNGLGYSAHNGTNGHANGHANGHHCNGHDQNGPIRKRIPPGGFSNGII